MVRQEAGACAIVKRLKEQRSSDLKLIDELLCCIKRSTKWEAMETGFVADGGPAVRDAMARLRQAWANGEMALITLSLATYFKKENHLAEEEAEAPEGNPETQGP